MKLSLVFIGLFFSGLFMTAEAVYGFDSCHGLFAVEGAGQLSPAATQALMDLAQFTAGYDQHSVEIKDGRGYVKIDRLVRDQSTFKRLLYKAIKAGAIADIDAGLVAGPKVLTLLSRLRRVEPASSEPIHFHGYLRPSGLFETLKRQLDDMDSGRSPGGAWLWTEADVADFHNAVKEFELENVCKGVFGVALKYCGYMNFEFSSGSDTVKWEKRAL